MIGAEALRKEAGEYRQALTANREQQDQITTAIEQLEAQVTQLGDYRNALRKQAEQIEQMAVALENAALTLSEQMPTLALTLELPPLAPPPAIPEPVVEAEVVVEDEEEAEVQVSHRQMSYVIQRAQELDLDTVSPMLRDTADLIAMILCDYGPMRQYQLAEVLDELDETGLGAGAWMSRVGNALPVLFRMGRIRSFDPTRSRYALWEATPEERASAGLGTDIENYKGRTTNWPKAIDKPVGDGRIVVESQAFESKR